MAKLSTCKTCGKEVSITAKSCPHCGQSNPGTKASDVLKGLAVIVLVVILVSQCTGSTEKTGTAPKLSDAECRKDLQCWGDRHNIEASVRCDNAIEKLAKYTSRWTDGALEMKFPRMGWADKNAGTLTYIGDKLEFQNGFGAWQGHVYECDYNPDTKMVINARARPGRL